MSITWATLRQQIRDVILLDLPDEETNEFKWSNEQLLAACAWALETFADHTAVATATSYPVNDDNEYSLPGNILDDDPVDLTLTVFSELSDGTRQYLDPIRYSSVDGIRIDNGEGFYVNQNGKLKVTKDLGSAETLHLWYYAYYDAPALDSDLVKTPRWSNAAISYLVAAHCLSGDSLKSANIKQYNQRPDTGHPEHNPIARQQERYFKMYEQEISRRDPQIRVNYTRYQEQ